jgi:hypothetical protein
MRIISAMVLAMLAGPVLAEDASSASGVPDLFLGKWEGTATAFFPRDPERQPRRESVTAECTHALKDTYVRCRTTWVSEAGDSRELLIFWNHNSRENNVQVLYLYDNWPGKVNYPLEWDPETRTITGADTFTAADNVAAEERVRWQFAADGTEISSIEENHYSTDPEDYWARSFEFTWQRIGD